MDPVWRTSSPSLAIFALRFAVADTLIWAERGRDRRRALLVPDPRPGDGRVARSALRELERFRVDEPIDKPTIRVRLGRLNRTQSDLVSTLRRLDHTHPLRRGARPARVRGRYQLEGSAIDIVAAPMLRYSPHVLYTNVVEPTLRWCFVEPGLRARPLRLYRRRRQCAPDHREDRHRQDDDDPQAARPPPGLVPLRRPDAASRRTGGSDVPEAADRSAGTPSPR